MNRPEPAARPRALRAGSTVGVCAPAGPVNLARLASGIRWLEDAGFQVRRGPHLCERHGYLAGSDEQRLGDLCALLADDAVDAIFAARGGYGVSRLLGRLDADAIAAARTLMVGYSDTTALSLWLLRKAGLASIHGPMLERDDVTPSARGRLLALAAGEAVQPLVGEALRVGSVVGPLVGGNLRMILSSLGTPWEIQTEGAILFFEEVAEQPYAVDRSILQLRDAGKLAGVAGVAVGQLVDCTSERYPDYSVDDVLREVLIPAVNGPVLGGLPFGHVADNHALGIGVRARLRAERVDGAGSLDMLEPVVEVETES